MTKYIREAFLFIGQLLFNSFLTKLLALVIAVTAWYLIQQQEKIELNRQIKVNLFVPEGYGIDGNIIVVKDATIKGSRGHLARLAKIPLEAEVTIKKTRPGTYRVRLNKDHINNWNDRVKLIVHEPYIRIAMDKLEHREIPVDIFLQGVPADNFIIEKTSVEPDTVRVSGLTKKIEKLQKISTLPIEIDGLKKNESYRVNLAEQDSGITLNVQEVQVALQVGEKKINKEIKGIPIEILDEFYETKMTPNTVAITVQGVPAILEFVEVKSFKAFVDVGGFSPGRYERKITAKIPEGTVLIEIRPESTIVNILEEMEDEKDE